MERDEVPRACQNEVIKASLRTPPRASLRACGAAAAARRDDAVTRAAAGDTDDQLNDGWIHRLNGARDGRSTGARRKSREDREARRALA